ncbi:uncharacterized protein LOC131014167 [Salvia miltiorrhiza]|uniref:uncharacterized protein LOC131014167 n=1 Tax=Salvia miltiorrhiza TaxID=226208 RepID=UPI0025AD78D4|nr:uncharacterized protein LOC131014167 [Salvia miltiorrhiza]
MGRSCSGVCALYSGVSALASLGSGLHGAAVTSGKDYRGIDESFLSRTAATEAKKLRSLKAKIKWLKEGDINSGFFHRAIRGRRVKNEIGGMLFENSWISKPEEVKVRVKNHFEAFFKRKERLMPDFPLDFMRRKISNDERQWLIRDFDLDEIKEAVWSCCGDKSPGPDGFNFTFWRAAWPVVKEDLVQVLKEFHENGKIPKGGNASFIVLIPKKEGAGSLEDFRPISLITSLFKIVAKILAERLKRVMGSIISDNQSAFVKGRFILDGVVILNEAIFEYADDTIFLLEADDRNMESVKKLLILFQFVSGLAVNFDKSCLLTVGVDEAVERRWASLLMCKIGSFPCNYLGRITLVKSVLQSIPVYQLSFAFIPKAVIKELNSLFSKFLWGGGTQTGGITWFKWNALCLNKDSGGLGFRNIDWFNKVLLSKWLWRFLGEGKALWVRVIKSIYGELEWGEGGECSVVGRGGQKGWWQKIVDKEGGMRDRWFINNLRRRIGDGLETSFWEDVWAVDKPLKFVFPRLYNLSLNKKRLVGESGFWVGGSWVWRVEWRRELREREKGFAEELRRMELEGYTRWMLHN